MRNLLALIGAGVLTFGFLGWYLGWYSLQSVTADANGKRSVTIDVDPAKIGKDARRFNDKIHDVIDKVTDDDKPSTSPKSEPASKVAQ